jgi:hypothetical protein
MVLSVSVQVWSMVLSVCGAGVEHGATGMGCRCQICVGGFRLNEMFQQMGGDIFHGTMLHKKVSRSM